MRDIGFYTFGYSLLEYTTAKRKGKTEDQLIIIALAHDI